VNVRERFPCDVTTIEHVWIPMPDGCRLAARIWLPSDAEDHPVPAILEYIPYRKNDATSASDALRHPYFAGHGYASIRVDIRGSGDSEGLLLDEYLPQEQQDALDVLTWLGEQAWCTGAVGMMGFSWGGFNSLQVAARRPPQLKAIISVNSADDRYAGDCHYSGGSVLAYDMLSWGTTMAAFTGRPPDPPVVGDRWREMWRERLDAEPFVHAWLSHQTYDAYWKQGSVCEDYGAIECPVFAVGGWHDPYRDTVLNLLSGLSVPRLGLLGPWAHGYPDEARPGPQIGFNQECLRWWDHWLKGADTGIMDEPLLRAYVLDDHETATFFAEHPGHWVSEAVWPPTRSATRLFFGTGTLEPEPARGRPLSLRGVETAGQDAGGWCPYAGRTELPPDQRLDDALSLVFDSEPLDEPLEALGTPLVELALSADRPLAFVAVRLCDVSPDGSSALVTRGTLNLTHRVSREHPAPLVPGERYQVRVPLVCVGYRFAVGHKLRVSVSPSYWPWLWPSPEPVTLTLFTESSTLELPTRPVDQDEVPAFPPVEVAAPPRTEVIGVAKGRRILTRDVGLGRHEIAVDQDHLPGRVRLVAEEREVGEWGKNTYSIVEGDPLSASVRCERVVEVAGRDWSTVTEVDATMTCDENDIFVKTHVRAVDGDSTFFERTWTMTIPRVCG
jgi:putative CocE/NonD family hydrolase